MKGDGTTRGRKGGRERTARIADDANAETSRHAAQPDGEPGAELQEGGEEGRLLPEVAGDEDGGDEAVDGQDLGHDGAQRVLHEAVGAQDARGEDGGGRLGGAVGGADDGQRDG
ncbi:hypothetical protein VDGD_21278 [Verticillium dahliae]|nr:hypothetical protein VDGD_21278 [Verticillium dahliae]